MTDSGVRLLALTILFPVLVVVALAVALIGCDVSGGPQSRRLGAPRSGGASGETGRCPSVTA
jgi:hypothetical protein